jgi:hypothetical protein
MSEAPEGPGSVPLRCRGGGRGTRWRRITSRPWDVIMPSVRTPDPGGLEGGSSIRWRHSGRVGHGDRHHPTGRECRAEGPSGLADEPRSGRPPRPSEDQPWDLDAVVEAGPDLETDGVVRWRCVDLQRVVPEKYDVALGERSVDRILNRRCGWAYLFGAVCPNRAMGAGPVVPDDLTLVKLGAYASEPDPTGNVWAYPCGTKLAHRLSRLRATSWLRAAMLATPS